MAVDAALRVLYVAPEIAPWVKTGGLGEVAQGLPPALAAAGAQVRLLVPAYPA
ncbi:MAG: glycogen/starch synthase, partial [Burkholderiales bacterium]